MNDLPDTFDLIVVGTGMPECIIAAAAARAGKSVLHLDRNGFYGGDWASFNFEQMLDWIKDNESPTTVEVRDRFMQTSWSALVPPDDDFPLCPTQNSSVHGVVQYTYVRRKRVEENQTETNLEHCTAEAGALEENAQVAESGETTDVPTESAGQNSPQQELQELSNNTEAASNDSAPSDLSNEIEESSNPSEEINQQEAGPSGVDNEPEVNQNIVNEVSEGAHAPTAETREWTFDDLWENRRKFNIDLSPKLLFSRGSLVELLISSNIARYAEFQGVNRILTNVNGRLEQVPCSRADVFSTKNVSVVEKRMLMKLLTFCMEYEKHPEEYKGYEDKPFIEFLRSRKVTENIEHYVLHAIAMVEGTCPTLQGLQSTQKFMESLGRYGNSPFLWTCYGSAELPQCFCRLCAVFGGIYYLKRDVDGLIVNSADGACVGVISDGKLLNCSSLVMEYSYAPLLYLPDRLKEQVCHPRKHPPGYSHKMISRAIYIADASILPAERQQNTLLRLPPVAGVHNAITVLEFGSLSFMCPRNIYLVHLISQSFSDDESVESEFRLAETLLFKPKVSEEGGGEEMKTDDCTKPNILWCTYFKLRDVTSLDLSDGLPHGLFLTSSVSAELDYEHAVREAHEIFEKLYPGEEFLPRAPDPEDIIMEEHSNPGTHVDNLSNAEENSNVENDVKSEDSVEEQCSTDDGHHSDSAVTIPSEHTEN